MADKSIKLEELDRGIKGLWAKMVATFARNKKYSISELAGGDYTFAQMNSKISGGSFTAFAADVYNSKVLKMESVTCNGETTRNVSVCCQGSNASTVTKMVFYCGEAMVVIGRKPTGWRVDRYEIFLT